MPRALAHDGPGLGAGAHATAAGWLCQRDRARPAALGERTLAGRAGRGPGPPGTATHPYSWLFTAIQSGFQSFSLFQDGAIQILELSGYFRTAGLVFQDRLSVVQDGSG
jgi:hypothetical protein